MRLSDLELVERVQAGNVAAYEELVRRYQDRIYTYVCRMTGGADDAADVTQEVFIKVYTSLSRFRAQASFQTWIYRVATNLCVDRHRRRQRLPEVVRSTDRREGEDGDLEADLPDWDDNPERATLTDELRVEVREAVMALTEKLRAVVVMHDLQGLSYEEISAALDIPLGTVKSRLFNARAMLRESLREYVESDEESGRQAARTGMIETAGASRSK